MVGAPGATRGCCVCCFNLWTRSGRGGTIGRAVGCPAKAGRPASWGRGAIGAPGVKPGAGRGGVGRGGIGAPGTVDAEGEVEAAPGATTCVGGCGALGSCCVGAAGAADCGTGRSGAETGRAGRCSRLPKVGRGVSGGSGCLGPAGGGAAGAEGPGRGIDCASGRAGIGVARFTIPGEGACGDEATSG